MEQILIGFFFGEAKKIQLYSLDTNQKFPKLTYNVKCKSFIVIKKKTRQHIYYFYYYNDESPNSCLIF